MTRSAVAVALLATLVAGCATAPDFRPAPGDPRAAQARVAGVPFYPQRQFQCGPASLAMALNAADAGVTVDEMVPAVFLPGRQGSVQPEMLAAPRRFGRVSYPVYGSLDALITEVDAGNPVVVLQNLALSWLPMWHYAVVIGYDLERRQLVLHSGTSEATRVSMGRFDRTWARGDRWAMVALPPQRLPASADARTALEAIHDFERVAGAVAAAPAWVAATERWPHHELAWFARGNAHYERRELTDARDAFLQAVSLEPGLGPGWINLGHLYSELGEVDLAWQALRRAAMIDGPWQATAATELERLQRTPPL